MARLQEDPMLLLSAKTLEDVIAAINAKAIIVNVFFMIMSF